jgi:uncharacterized membrane protein YkvA (DUF1232 family)
MTPDKSLALLQRLVGGYADSVAVTLDALTDEQTPAPARRVLCGVLNYALDLLDIFPDHYEGLGLTDDAMLLRLGARQAVSAGATQATLRQLGDEATELEPLLGDLLAPLEQYVTKLAERTVRGRTVAQILGDKVVLGVFVNDIQRQVTTVRPKNIDSSISAAWSVDELRRMLKHELKRAGLLTS